jgi:hypothetical protein
MLLDFSSFFFGILYWIAADRYAEQMKMRFDSLLIKFVSNKSGCRLSLVVKMAQ